MTGLRELEEQIDQYDQDRKRLEWLLDNANEQIVDLERTRHKLQFEIDEYKIDYKRIKKELKESERVSAARLAMGRRQIEMIQERDAEIERLQDAEDTAYLLGWDAGWKCRDSGESGDLGGKTYWLTYKGRKTAWDPTV